MDVDGQVVSERVLVDRPRLGCSSTRSFFERDPFAFFLISRSQMKSNAISGTLPPEYSSWTSIYEL